MKRLNYETMIYLKDYAQCSMSLFEEKERLCSTAYKARCFASIS